MQKSSTFSSTPTAPPPSFLVKAKIITGSKINFTSLEQIVKPFYCTTGGFSITDCDYVSQSSSGQRESQKVTVQRWAEGRFTKHTPFPSSHLLFFTSIATGLVDASELGLPGMDRGCGTTWQVEMKRSRLKLGHGPPGQPRLSSTSPPPCQEPRAPACVLLPKKESVRVRVGMGHGAEKAYRKVKDVVGLHGNH